MGWWMLLGLALPGWDAALEAQAPELARRAAQHWLMGTPRPRATHPRLREPGAVFVTVVKGGRVRGCWGSVSSQTGTLGEEIVRHTRMAVMGDPRFPPVAAGELKSLTFLVSVVGPLRPLRHQGELRPKLDGLLVTDGRRTGVLLPGEAKTAAWQVRECRRKAGLSPHAPARLYRFATLLLGDHLP